MTFLFGLCLPVVLFLTAWAHISNEITGFRKTGINRGNQNQCNQNRIARVYTVLTLGRSLERTQQNRQNSDFVLFVYATLSEKRILELN